MPLRRMFRIPRPREHATPLSSGHTTDRDDPRLGHGVDTEPTAQHSAYLVLSDDERSRGFVRPVRIAYVHVGPPGPRYPLRDLTAEERARWGDHGYLFYEPIPQNDEEIRALVVDGIEPSTGRFWTQERLDAVGAGCGAVTTMSLPIAETYAREPGFYGATYCVRCAKHLPVGRDGEFVWDGTNERVGT